MKYNTFILLLLLVSSYTFSQTTSETINEQKIELSEFTGIHVSGSFDITIKKGIEQSVTVTGPQGKLDLLSRKVSNNIWEVREERSFLAQKIKDGQAKYKYKTKGATISIVIVSPKLNSIDISGSADVQTEGFDNLKNLNLRIIGSGGIKSISPFTVSEIVKTVISGSGKMDVAVVSKKHVASLVGSGEIIVGGYTESQKIVISGSGNIDSHNMNSESSMISITGSGDVHAFVNNTLDVKISGSGDVHYMGNPEVNKSVTGSGSVKNSN